MPADALPAWQQLAHFAPVTAVLVIVSGLSVWVTLKIQEFTLKHYKKSQGGD